MIDKGADIEAKDSNGWTTLYSAGRGGHIKIVRLLCDCGADFEARSTFFLQSGWRPLHHAACHDHISIVKELIEVRNAGINARNNRGETALRLAQLYGGKIDVAAYLVSHGGII